MEKATLQLETLSCPSCMQKIEGALKLVNGVDKDSIKVLFNSSKVKTNFDSAVTSVEDIQKAIEEVGYPVLKTKVKAA
ncbi:heavy-metal-associated domain-containing protein [Desemzia incerta]|uniref:heavy-metal-associated domain-containing protein n=1 Tax=Desemzia TaxID=82800 RepID=UPI0016612C04|nr:heavy-metal-associated domain-containing protein [Desemzia incerta]WHZ32861.1 heavy-metal-associated domain-containing protein [Desemzia incerta]